LSIGVEVQLEFELNENTGDPDIHYFPIEKSDFQLDPEQE
jgi:hypothetical protein